MMLLTAAAAAIPGAVSPAPAKRAEVRLPRPGFTCGIEEHYESEAWASATLDAGGRQVRAGWLWGSPRGMPGPHFTAESEIRGPAILRPGDGLATAAWYRPADRRVKTRLELTVSPDGASSGPPAFKGDYDRGDRATLRASWADLLAFARRASRLTAVARGRGGGIRERIEIDPATLTNGAARIESVLRQLADKVAHFRERCDPADIDPDGIVVTDRRGARVLAGHRDAGGDMSGMAHN